MNRILSLALLAAGPAALTSCLATPRPAGRLVSPGQLFSGQLLDIRAPNSEGWVLMTSNSGGVEFAKRGAEPNESYAAQLLRFTPPRFEQSEEFVAFVKDGVAKDTGPDRFDILSSDIKVSKNRPYPCVSVEYTARDLKAQISRTKTEALVLQTISLYCQHPSRRDLGFAIIYSHRGSEIDPDLRHQAEDFIKGIDVPGK